jgi:hypothetical protein
MYFIHKATLTIEMKTIKSKSQIRARKCLHAAFPAGLLNVTQAPFVSVEDLVVDYDQPAENATINILNINRQLTTVQPTTLSQ